MSSGPPAAKLQDDVRAPPRSISSDSTEETTSLHFVPRKRRRALSRQFRPIVPDHYICPITQELMTDPVIVASGHTFERRAIEEWLKDGNDINPLTGDKLCSTEIKPNYALQNALDEYRRKLADELFRITFDGELSFRSNVLFGVEKGCFAEDEKLQSDRHSLDEHDGYLSDDEQEVDPLSPPTPSVKRRRRRRLSSCRRRTLRNIPIISFLGPNNSGKSTLLNLIAGEPVFVTMDELTDFDSLSQVVRCKMISRTDGHFILLDADGLFPDRHSSEISDAALKLFCALYSISSVMVWNDTVAESALLRRLLLRAHSATEGLRRPFGIAEGVCLEESVLPEALRGFLRKKYRRVCCPADERRPDPSTARPPAESTHKPALIVLRRDCPLRSPQYRREALHRHLHLHGKGNAHCDTASSSDAESTKYVVVRSSAPPMSALCGASPSSGDSLSAVPELAQSSSAKAALEEKEWARGSGLAVGRRDVDFLCWLRRLGLFSFVDDAALHKLDAEQSDDSVMSGVLHRVDRWIHEWCRRTVRVVPIVRNGREMQCVVAMLNRSQGLSSVRFVEQLMRTKGSRLPIYFGRPRTRSELKMLAERFQWDQQNVARWFQKHFNRLWFASRHWPNAHHALLFQALFYEHFLSDDSLVPCIMLNLSRFYFELDTKVDLYRDIVQKSADWGSFAGAISGLSSLSLIAVHPLFVAAVPLSIHFGSSLGANSGSKIGDAIANSKSRYLDGTERYGFGKGDGVRENSGGASE